MSSLSESVEKKTLQYFYFFCPDLAFYIWKTSDFMNIVASESLSITEASLAF